MKLLLLSGLFVLFASLPVRADVWKDVGSSKDGTFVQINTDSIIANNGSYEYNLFVIDISLNKFFFVREQMLCEQRQIRVLKVSTVDNQGQAITSQYLPYTPDDNFKPILVDNLGAATYKFICK